jgi:sugar lactone lactonase YvrE
VCFGGKRLDTLFITTARKDLKPDALAAQPGAGGLFKLRVGVQGVPESRFGQRLF